MSCDCIRQNKKAKFETYLVELREMLIVDPEDWDSAEMEGISGVDSV